MKNKKRKPGRPPGNSKRKLPVKFQCEMDPDLKEWLKVQVKKKVFRNMTHGVEYCLSIMKNVFDQREDQILDLAKSHPLGVIVNDIDSKIAGENNE